MYSRDRVVSHQTSLPLFCLQPSTHPSTVLSNTPSFCFRSCAMICLLQLCLVSSNGFGIQREWPSYYRLGKNRPCSGILSRYSRLALIVQAIPTMLASTRPTTAVLPFQLAGWAYQPPAGDQTCLGYLQR
jgi:hypothetical protein